MLNVNVDNVLYGNPFKGLSIMYSDVVSKNDDESAKAYHDYYSKLPLSAILPSSELIFKESRYGIKYYIQIIEDDFMPYYMYNEQYKKLNDFVNSVKDFTDEERADYDKALCILKKKVDDTCRSMAPFSIEFTNTLFHNNRSYDIDLMDALHDRSFEFSRPDDRNITEIVNAICSNRLGFILYGPAIFVKVPADAFAMEKLNSFFISDCDGYGDFTSTAYSVILLKLMYQDKMYRDLIEANRNVRFRNLINDWVDTDPKALISNVLCSPVNKDNTIISEFDENDSPDILESVFSAIESVDESEKDDPLYTERVNVKKYILNFYAESLSTILINGDDYKLNGSILFTENTNVSEELDLTDKSIAECCELLGESYDNYSEFTESDLRAIESDLRPYFEDTEVDDDSDEEENESDKDAPDSPNKGGVKIRLTNVALDADKKAREAEAKLDERMTATKKLGRAVMAVPNHIRKNIDDATEMAREAKKNRLKKKILNDGYRSKWWKKIITATKYRMLGSVNVLLMPMYWLLRRANRTQNRRLKDDLIKDFKLELTILNDQLEDASREMNTKEKENIRRKIDKIERELKRVRYNINAVD